VVRNISVSTVAATSHRNGFYQYYLWLYHVFGLFYAVDLWVVMGESSYNLAYVRQEMLQHYKIYE
jgi:hypothetical protein